MQSNPMELTKENYYSREADAEYMSYSQFKQFTQCEEKALAKIEGRLPKEMDMPSQSMVQSSYIDAYFSGELEEFSANHPEMFSSKGATAGQLKAEFKLADSVIQSIETDESYKKLFYSGKTQEIVTGEIAGVLFKGKLDFLYDDYIVDAKAMASLDPVWDDKSRTKLPFYEFYGYDIQGAIYSELARQKYGREFGYYLAPVTKEKYPKKEAYRFSKEYLAEALKKVEELAPRYQRIKNHEIEPIGCGVCDYCRSVYKFNPLDIKEVSEHNG